MFTSGMPHIIGKLSTRAISLLHTSPQSKVNTTSYGLKSGGSFNFRNFKTCDVGVLRQNDIWVQPLWPIIDNTIRGKVVASPKSGSWSILWVRVCSWFVHAPKVFQLCTNQLVVWFLQGCMNNWLHCHLSWSPSWNSNTPKMLRTKKTYPNSFFFYYCHFQTRIWVFQGVWRCIALYMNKVFLFVTLRSRKL